MSENTARPSRRQRARLAALRTARERLLDAADALDRAPSGTGVRARRDELRAAGKAYADALQAPDLQPGELVDRARNADAGLVDELTGEPITPADDADQDGADELTPEQLAAADAEVEGSVEGSDPDPAVEVEGSPEANDVELADDPASADVTGADLPDDRTTALQLVAERDADLADLPEPIADQIAQQRDLFNSVHGGPVDPDVTWLDDAAEVDPGAEQIVGQVAAAFAEVVRDDDPAADATPVRLPERTAAPTRKATRLPATPVQAAFSAFDDDELRQAMLQAAQAVHLRRVSAAARSVVDAVETPDADTARNVAAWAVELIRAASALAGTIDGTRVAVGDGPRKPLAFRLSPAELADLDLVQRQLNMTTATEVLRELVVERAALLRAGGAA